MVAGHLRVQNGYWQMILSYKDSTGKRANKIGVDPLEGKRKQTASRGDAAGSAQSIYERAAT